MFATHGLPCQVVSDNGPEFRSAEFADFIRRNGIKHILCSPYHPSLNGLVKRFVQTFKNAMKAGRNDEWPLQHRLDSFLLIYRCTPHATAGQAPCQLSCIVTYELNLTG